MLPDGLYQVTTSNLCAGFIIEEGKVVLRGSIYGKFYGCSLYPKCKYTEKLIQPKSGN